MPRHAAFAQLAKLAPMYAFEAVREEDADTPWDGDGPEPDGVPYTVAVTGRVIRNGAVVEFSDYIGGVYLDESLDDDDVGDVSGYLPQMLLEVIEQLRPLDGKNDLALEKCAQYLRSMLV